MKKLIIPLAFITVFILSLVGCTTEKKGELTRIDVFITNQDDTHIQDKDTLALTENALEQVKWKPDIKPSMAREADAKATLFYTFDENMPERLYEYEIWFNENAGTATIISNNEKEGYGELDKDNTKIIKNIFFK